VDPNHRQAGLVEHFLSPEKHVPKGDRLGVAVKELPQNVQTGASGGQLTRAETLMTIPPVG
jgi:hypothetical protein